MDPPAELDAEFHDWYDTEHIPVRLDLPGFRSAIRYQSTGAVTRFLVCYFIDDLEVLQTPAYERIKAEPGPRTRRMLGEVSAFTRFTCELTGDTGQQGPVDHLGVHVVQCSPGEAATFEQQYESEAKRLISSDGEWERVRCYRTFGANAGGLWTHIALHEAGGAVEAPPSLRLAGIQQESWWTYRVIRRAGEVADPTPARA